MSKHKRIELPVELATKLAGMIDNLEQYGSITIVGWGFELILYESSQMRGIQVYISDTSGG
jgi:hypothetical protein